jgi:ribosomal protein S18 acetylase RimI-like enzyme
LRIGSIADDEVAEVVTLWERCGLTRPWNDPIADIALARERPTSDLLVGRLDGRIVASVMVGTDGHRCWFYYLSVDPALQRQGFGRAMVEACEAWARDHGVPKIQLIVRKGNLAAAGFYQALGFKLEDTVQLGKRLDGKSWATAGDPKA